MCPDDTDIMALPEVFRSFHLCFGFITSGYMLVSFTVFVLSVYGPHFAKCLKHQQFFVVIGKLLVVVNGSLNFQENLEI